MKPGTLRYFSFALILIVSSCEDFVQVDLPDSQVGSSQVFNSDATAIAAANGMYRTLMQTYGLLNGTLGNATLFGGLSSDELTSYTINEPVREIFLAGINVDNAYIRQVWGRAYNAIYESNAVLEGASASMSLSPAVKNQVLGEAYFIRSLCHLYLINFFNDVPLVTTTDYRINATLPRASVDLVYNQIRQDLTDAQTLLTDNYYTPERIRPNKAAATALLARVQLYQKNYADAITSSSAIINSVEYTLQTLSTVFLKESREAIWQLTQTAPGSFPTGDAFLFIMVNNNFQFSLSNELINAFEPADDRRTSWVSSRTNTNGTFYYAHKYRERTTPANTPFKEYLVVLRLAEQYLIRAEAYANNDQLPEAIADLDVIRDRAGLPLLATTNPDITKDELIDAILHERQIELFCEMGHRWFDLKRTDRADAVIGPLKPGWTTEDQLYPIPESEMLSNPFLKPNNPGY